MRRGRGVLKGLVMWAADGTSDLDKEQSGNTF